MPPEVTEYQKERCRSVYRRLPNEAWIVNAPAAEDDSRWTAGSRRGHHGVATAPVTSPCYHPAWLASACQRAASAGSRLSGGRTLYAQRLLTRIR